MFIYLGKRFWRPVAPPSSLWAHHMEAVLQPVVPTFTSRGVFLECPALTFRTRRGLCTH